MITGGCLCGTVRYAYAGELGPSSYCHCDDCRKATGGPYTVGARAELDKLEFVSGAVKEYTSVADSGKKITRAFCPDCGSPILTKADAAPGLCWLKGGCLDHPEQLTPRYHSWIDHAVPWAFIEDNLPRYSDNGP